MHLSAALAPFVLWLRTCYRASKPLHFESLASERSPAVCATSSVAGEVCNMAALHVEGREGGVFLCATDERDAESAGDKENSGEVKGSSANFTPHTAAKGHWSNSGKVPDLLLRGERERERPRKISFDI